VSVRVGEEMRDYAISAIVSAPETLKVQITDDAWGSHADFGYAYAPVGLLEKEDKKERDNAIDELDEQGDKLNDAEKEAQGQLDDAEQQLKDAEALLAEKDELFADAQQTAMDKKRQLEETRKQLISTRSQLQDTLRELDASKPKLESGISQLNDGIALLRQAKQALADIDSGIAELNDTRAQLADSSVSGAVDMLRSLSPNLSLDELFNSADKLRSFTGVAAGYGINLDFSSGINSALNRIRDYIDRVEADREYLASDQVSDILNRATAGEITTDDPDLIRLVEVIIRYYPSYSPSENLNNAHARAYDRATEIHNAITDYHVVSTVDYLDQITDISLQGAFTNVEVLRTLRGELESSSGKSISTGGQLVSEYDSALNEIDANIAELNSQRSDIITQLNDNGADENSIDDKVSDLQSQLDEAEDQLSKLPSARAEINDGLDQIADGLQQIEEGNAEIDRQLAEAKSQLDEAHREYDDGLNEYNESLADSVSEFAKLREELESAYAQLDEQEGYDSLCNQFLIFTKDGYDRDQVLEAAVTALGDTNIKKSYSYKDSPVYDKIKQNLDTIETMATFMPMVYFGVALIVVFLFMTLVIKQSRREIGILRALGFSKGSVRVLFCGVELVTSCVAVAIGIGLGLVLTHYFCEYFRDFFPLPQFFFRVDTVRTVLAGVLTVGVGEAATLIGTSVISRIQPSEAMTRPAPSSVKTPKLLAAITKNARPMIKFSLSSLLRNRLRFVFSVVCIAASVMMIFSSLAFRSSKNNALHQLYDLRLNYDCQIFWSAEPSDEEIAALKELPYVRDVQKVGYYETEFWFNGRSRKAVINSIDIDTNLIGVYDSGENRLAIPEDGIIIERHLAEYLGAGVGDTVLADGAELVITGISDQSLSRFQYTSPEAAKGLGDVSLGTVILDVDRQDEQKLLGHMVGRENYLFTVFTHVAYEGNAKVFQTYDIASAVIIGFAVIIGLTIVYNTAQTNLLEKKKELCILRTLGFPHGEISANWFVQSLLQYIAAIAVGMPLGIKLAKTALIRLSNEKIEFAYSNGYREYIITAALVLAYVVISHFISMRSMRKWDMVETVKEKE